MNDKCQHNPFLAMPTLVVETNWIGARLRCYECDDYRMLATRSGRILDTGPDAFCRYCGGSRDQSGQIQHHPTRCVLK